MKHKFSFLIPNIWNCWFFSLNRKKHFYLLVVSYYSLLSGQIWIEQNLILASTTQSVFERSLFSQTKNADLMNVNNFPLIWLFMDCFFHQWCKIIKCINTFLIYTHRSNKSDEVLDQAWQKITGIQQQKFLPMAKELHGEDPHQFLRAFSAGK